uniref:Uncharacterized protein n=1 Tax=Meloidogyne incognita TaxID=6306 RepID=A0A914LYY7_MELIC
MHNKFKNGLSPSSPHFPISNKFLRLRTTLIFLIFLTQMTNILHSAPVGNEEKGAIKSPRSEIVAYEHWHCGSDDFDKSLSHQMAREQCPKRMFEADLCCVVHDACYMDETRNRQICDEQFCHCLERTVARSQNFNGNNKTVEIKENGCLDVSSTFCHIVNIFGGVAYASSVDLVNKQKAAMEVWEKQEAEKKKKAKELIEAEKKNKSKNVGDEAKNKGDNKEANKDEKSAVIHKFPLKDCSDKRLVDCSVQLQSCTNNLQNKKLEEGNIEANGNSFALLLSAKLAECTNQFCKCSSTKLLTKIEQNDKECVSNLANICAQFSDDFGGILEQNFEKTKSTYLSLWSVNLNHQTNQNSVGLTVMCTLLALLVITTFLYILTKIINLIKKRCGEKSTNKHKDYLKAKIRRNTLTNALRHVGGVGGDDNDDEDFESRGGKGGPHYISLSNQKKPSTVSSPTDSVATSQQLLISCHTKTNSEALQDNKKPSKTLNKPTNLLLTSCNTNLINNSSSQTQLIGEGTNNNSNANSSSTLSDISISA